MDIGVALVGPRGRSSLSAANLTVRHDCAPDDASTRLVGALWRSGLPSPSTTVHDLFTAFHDLLQPPVTFPWPSMTSHGPPLTSHGRRRSAPLAPRHTASLSPSTVRGSSSCATSPSTRQTAGSPYSHAPRSSHATPSASSSVLPTRSVPCRTTLARPRHSARVRRPSQTDRSLTGRCAISHELPRPSHDFPRPPMLSPPTSPDLPLFDWQPGSVYGPGTPQSFLALAPYTDGCERPPGLRPNWWRLSEHSQDIRACRPFWTEGEPTPCRGGNGTEYDADPSSYCAAGLTGPLCHVSDLPRSPRSRPITPPSLPISPPISTDLPRSLPQSPSRPRCARAASAPAVTSTRPPPRASPARPPA